MAQYSLTMYEDDSEGNTVFRNNLDFKAEQLDDVIGNFELFLKGSGFVFSGHIDIVDNEITLHNTYTNLDLTPDYNNDYFAAAHLDTGPGEVSITGAEDISYAPNVEIKRPDDTEGGSVE